MRHAGAGEGRLRRAAATLAREPLVHFLVLAALLFAGYALLAPAAERIVVARAAVDRAVQEQEAVLGRSRSVPWSGSATATRTAAP